jgi:hypothetical protein
MTVLTKMILVNPPYPWREDAAPVWDAAGGDSLLVAAAITLAVVEAVPTGGSIGYPAPSAGIFGS